MKVFRTPVQEFKEYYYPDGLEHVEGQVVELMVVAGPFTLNDDLKFEMHLACNAFSSCPEFQSRVSSSSTAMTRWRACWTP